MADASDMDLVREFAGHNSEAAFAELVRRHINLVYSVALRFTGNSGDAQDVTQAVFIILARKAARLNARTVLAGWLYETTRFTATRLLRTKARRWLHEQEASVQSTLEEPGADNMWHQLAPHLEAAMSRLAERDRTLLALRFYENKTSAEAAAQLGIREEAARKRTRRALEKLRNFFAKHGVRTTSDIIAGAISANSIQVAPVALAKTVTALAITKGAAASGSTLTLIKGALKIMAWTKVKTITVAALAVIVGTSITTVAVKKLTPPKPVVAANPGDWIWRPYSQSFDRVPPIFLFQPSTLPAKTAPYFYFGKDGYLARGQTVKELIMTIWSQKNSAMKLVFAADLPNDKYDFIVTAQPHWWRQLESEVNQRFSLVEQIETREDGEVVVVRKAQ